MDRESYRETERQTDRDNHEHINQDEDRLSLGNQSPCIQTRDLIGVLSTKFGTAVNKCCHQNKT